MGFGGRESGFLGCEMVFLGEFIEMGVYFGEREGGD